MKLFRRLIAWSFFLGVVVAIGGGVFHWVRYRPRVLIETPQVVQHISADGRWLLTSIPWRQFTSGGPRHNDEKQRLNHGFLQVWDTRSGAVVRSFEIDMPLGQSANGREFASLGSDGRLQIIDWESGEQWSLDLQTSPKENVDLEFSPGARWLWIGIGAKHFIIDVEKRRLQHRPSLQSGNIRFSNDDRFAFWTTDFAISTLNLESGTVVTKSSPSRSEYLGKAIAVCRNRAEALITAEESLELWDLEAAQVKWRLPKGRWTGRFADLQWAETEDDLLIANSYDLDTSYRLEVVSMKAGRVLVEHSDATREGLRDYGSSFREYMSQGRFSPDASLYFFCEHASRLSAFDVQTGKLLWQAPGAFNDTCSKIVVSHDSASLLWLTDGSKPIQCIDARTGQIKAELGSAFIPRVLSFQSSLASRAGKANTVAIQGLFETADLFILVKRWLLATLGRPAPDERFGVLVVDVQRGRELLCLHQEVPSSVLKLSQDGSTLVNWRGQLEDRSNYVIEIWDIRPQRAYAWAGGAAFVTAAGLLLLVRWRRKRSAKKKPVLASAATAAAS